MAEGSSSWLHLNRQLPLRDAWVWSLAASVDRAIAVAHGRAADPAPGRRAHPATLRGAAAASEPAARRSPHQVAHPTADPVPALHEFRRSLRSARAVLRLARGLLLTEAFESLATALGQAVRPTSPQRDRDVLPGVLAALGAPAQAEVARRAVADLLAEDAPVDAQRLCALLREGAAQLLDVPPRFLAALPERVEWIDVERGLRRSYRRTQRSWRRARRGHDDAQLHALRRRVKELRDQLGLLAIDPSDRIGRSQRRLASLARALGEVTDLLALRAFIVTRRERLSPPAAETLLAYLEREITRRRARALATAGRLLRRPSRVASSRWIDAIVP